MLEARIWEYRNAFAPEQFEEHLVPLGNGSVREILKAWKPGFAEFAQPTIVIVDEVPILRERWDEPGVVTEWSILTVVPAPGAAAAVYIFYAIMVVAVAYSIYMAQKAMKINNPAEQPTPDPVYNLNAEKNVTKLSQPIEVAYGRNRIFPSYAARPFNRYVDGQQYLYQLFCVGQGEFEIENVYIEDTLIGNFREVNFQVYAPGQQATLFPDNVVTSNEIANVELFGPNESQFTIYGPFTLNPVNTLATRIEVDLSMPNGLYGMDEKDGDLYYVTVATRFEVRQIDNNDQPISDWAVHSTPTYNLRSTNPLRYTVGLDVAAGRWQIRGWRTNNKDTSTRVSNTIQWDAARAFLPNTNDYGAVTMLAVVAQATNNLNDNSQNRINVICTRKIPVYNGSTWNTQASRSAMWAYADIIRSKYGANLNQNFLDLTRMYAIDQAAAARGDYFDFVFNQKVSIWDALGTCCQVVRAEPLLIGTKFSVSRDEQKSVPVGLFSQDNIVEDTFEWNIEYFDPLDYDGRLVTYIDPVTFKEATVPCIPPGSSGVNLKAMRLDGSHDRNQAYHEGMFQALTNDLRRETVNFTTGLEGFIPIRGDLIAVSYDLPSWGTSGALEDVGTDNKTIYVDQDLPWVSGQTMNMMLRLDDGSGYGPFVVTRGADASIAIAASAINMDMFKDVLGRDPIMYMFGPVDEFARRLIVREVKPQGGEQIAISAVNEDNDVFDFDNITAPPVSQGNVPPKVPDLPEVPWVQASRIPSNNMQVLAVWGVALGAKTYYLQRSVDGVNWQNVVTTAGTSFVIDVTAGELYLRVCGINVGAGPWKQWNGQVGLPVDVPAPVEGLAQSYAWTGMQAKIDWSQLYDAEFYRVRVYDTSGDLMLTATSTTTSYTMDYNEVSAKNVVRRTYEFRVVGVNGLGESAAPASVTLSNPVPAKITNLGSSVTNNTDDTVTYHATWAAVQSTDIQKYMVWASQTSGFTPDGSTLIFEGLATAADIRVTKNSDGTVPRWYWRVAAIDYWGDEYNISDQQQTN